MNNHFENSVKLTNFAAEKIKSFIKQDKRNLNLKLRVHISGGGCGGFQYGFILDNKVSDDDYIVERNGAILVVDPLSLQYLFGGVIDYHEGLEGSRFVVINPNAKTICSCGASFSM